ncbi:adenosylmethionine--8-amino-7-oxononanoate transaminase [Edaphocola flava]|uniref:adenosylmethionine--8-amino-7-oxononanoate transaminase n=1 Tax=Edaphocola flava TaxID=2499629 RepID=UPI00100B907F|nr:adenosylmethionine--8-amino-7-oxononanoate transaminase [Edaphocola flava]
MCTLSERDRKVNWHPYTQMQTAAAAVPIVRGEGAYLYDDKENRYIDAISSWWVTLHGHANPYIARKVSEQLHTLEQVIFAGFTHEPAIVLSERLLELLPENQSKVFYSDNGSTAVEVALKMCLQQSYNKGLPKTKILAFTDAYHGDTFGAMSVSGRSVWTAPFKDQLFDVLFIDPPNADNLPAIKNMISQYAQELACFVYEPLIQGAAGMLMHRAEELDELLSFCRALNITLIQDEVFVGFGRTGKLFAANHLHTQPDIMCFSKGLTGGTMPMGITTCTEQVYQSFLSEDRYKALFHGHSFTANPLACAAALASMDLLLQEETLQRIQSITEQHIVFAQSITEHPKVKTLRHTGTILAIEWNTGEDTSYFNQFAAALYRYFWERGILIRPLGNILYLVPPYCISNEDLSYIYQTISQALDTL